MERLTKLTTEMYNSKSNHLDQMSTGEILRLMNEEDRLIPAAIEKVLPHVEKVIEAVYEAFKNDGRLFYVGAGTSGRIGLLDAVECPPTFSTSSDKVQAVLAGGPDAMMVSVEGAEDDPELGAQDLKERHLNERDVVIGIAASGRTPYVKGALSYASDVGATVVSLTSNENAEISKHADIAIEVMTGPEILTGSTRLKAATAHKMILNMISTASMVKYGKVYQNLMVDVNATNYKLRERSKQIICEATQVTYDEAEEVLEETNYEVKPAIVMILANVDYNAAKRLLDQTNGFVRDAINYHSKNI
ncbi:N-acetylmuramic acid 6-phosphate etherase [Tenuibacillus multivorans]|uniref:N-acetylmuramic acid 6-phosphate etherase n=1 Tax=Tenuibacillus multivorans TaxID=237069 RepID=A0A1H0C4L5_9BACI|nr:N-acetylmuramic acid 6-phosphate etherase [Tenuibacillus multivorans]GEL77763.1 N-acetylmuramic acid 6-phosphate etherase [Tenuibacillus multivorans]SDN52792.1 N-acetylmuramic acid 6-phosphate etherase [Tenuibacillus multivorans]